MRSHLDVERKITAPPPPENPSTATPTYVPNTLPKFSSPASKPESKPVAVPNKDGTSNPPGFVVYDSVLC